MLQVQDGEPGSSPNKLKGIIHSLFKKSGSSDVQLTALIAADVKPEQGSKAAADRSSSVSNHIAFAHKLGSPGSYGKAASDAGTTPHSASAAGTRPAFDNARENVLSDPGMPIPSPPASEAVSAAAVTAADIAAAAASLPVGQRSSNGSINEPGASVWLHEAAIGSVTQSPCASPAPTQHGGPNVRLAKGLVCQSVDDMYNVIFGNSAAGASPAPAGAPSASGGSFSSMQSSYHHMEGFGASAVQPGARRSGRYSSNGSISGTVSTAKSSSSVIGPLDDLLVPPGLPRIRTGTRHSGSDGSGSGFYPDSVTRSSHDSQPAAGVGLTGWHAPAIAAIAAALGPVTGHRSSARYGNNSYNYSTTGGSNPAQQTRKRLWERRQQAASGNDASSGYSSTGPSTPCPAVVTAASSISAPGGVWPAHSSTPSKAATSLAEIAARLEGGCPSAGDCGTPYSHSSCSATPLSHSYSNPDLTATGGSMPPACARALFGSGSQMDRPLMSTGSGSCLTRADSSFLNDHLSVASDDDYIREVNAENVLSSVWGPANGTSKLLSFKYSVATSPLNHPGRASPFRGSPFASPRSSHSMMDLLPLRSAASAVHSCPGSPLAHQHSIGSQPEDAALTAAAGQQRHRHPFGRCTTDSVPQYRPSPLQQQQHQRPFSDTADQRELNQRVLSTAGKPAPAAGYEVLDVSLASAVETSITTAGELQQQHRSMPVSTQQGDSSIRSTRRTSSSKRAGRAGSSPKAAVAALMAGWDSANSAAVADSTGAPRQSRYGRRQQSSSGTGVAAMTQTGPMQILRVSGDASEKVGPDAQESSHAAAEQTADRANSGSDRAAETPENGARISTPCSEHSGNSISATRSKSMPTPGHRSSTSSVLGFGNMVSSSSSPVARGPVGLATSFSTPPPHPHSHTAASADFQQQHPRLLSEPGSRQHSTRNKSFRISNTNIANPSRLSQSSAAGESPESQSRATGPRRSLSGSNSMLLSRSASSVNESEGQQEQQEQVQQVLLDQQQLQHSAFRRSDSSRSGALQLHQIPAVVSDAATAPATPGPVDHTSSGNNAALHPVDSADAALPGTDSTATPSIREVASAALDAAAAAVAESQVLMSMPSLPEVDFIERIGRGSFGEVYRGVWCGTVVAVKVIRVKQQLRPAGAPARLTDSAAGSSHNNSSGLQQQDSAAEHDQQIAMELAQHEYESWLNANLRHPNIVQLFTSFTVVLEDRPAGLLQGGSSGGGFMWCAGVSWKTHLVMEYCELGTMQGALQRGLFMDPSYPGRCNPLWVLITAKEFCVAAAYCHSMDVVHGDLKSSNVLLKAAATTALDGRGFTAKVSDFGLSRVMDAISAANGTTATSTAVSTSAGDATPTATGSGAPIGQWPVQPHFGALSHAAPELIRGEALSKASDVYSVGVLLWELVTGQAPYYGVHPGQLLNLKLTHPTSELLPFPDSAPTALSSLALDCWASDPLQRPSMSLVVDRLNNFALELLGEDQAVVLFPDIARALSAQRRSAAAVGPSLSRLSAQ